MEATVKTFNHSNPNRSLVYVIFHISLLKNIKPKSLVKGKKIKNNYILLYRKSSKWACIYTMRIHHFSILEVLKWLIDSKIVLIPNKF